MASLAELAGDLLERVRTVRPVVHNITNYVVMNSTANVLIALGASPIMAHAPEEMQDLASISSSLVVNIGTLSKSWIESINMACRIAVVKNKPFVFDPVGAGATRFRTETACNILKFSSPTVIRANASETLSLSTGVGCTRGVDSVNTVEQAMETASKIAASFKTVIACTGKTDLVTDGDRSFLVEGGSPLMSYITGTGCAASAIVGAFIAIESDPVHASVAALAFFKVAAEKAAAQATSPGSFWVKVIDALYEITPSELARLARISEA
jgi:hydroxyethylthiazole kinase